MERDVILVTFNYRLYLFGYVSFDDPELNIPGNAGFKDQVMALKWVKENIENFGGDSNNITIFGQSSGGGCAHYHIISPASKNLFQRSIIISGSAFNTAYAAIPRRNWAYRAAVLAGYQGPEVDRNILEFLETADPQVLFTAAGAVMNDHVRTLSFKKKY
jgi:carboxylesterase type B